MKTYIAIGLYLRLLVGIVRRIDKMRLWWTKKPKAKKTMMILTEDDGLRLYIDNKEVFFLNSLADVQRMVEVSGVLRNSTLDIDEVSGLRKFIGILYRWSKKPEISNRKEKLQAAYAMYKEYLKETRGRSGRDHLPFEDWWNYQMLEERLNEK
jgi:hypothetical protein